MNLVVTGGAGYIGGIVTAQLIESGHKVTIIDVERPGAIPAGAEFIQANCADLEKVLSPGVKIDAVLHFGGYIAVGESVVKPAKYWENNVVASLRLLQAVQTLGIEKLLFSSSAAVYGNPAQVPVSEDEPTAPTSPYGTTKLVMDMAISSFCVAYGLAAASLRYFNVAGAYNGLGEHHDPETHLIPLALAAAAKGTPFTLFGEDYPTPDGTCIRDYIHVADLARAHLLALEGVETGKHSIYNLGNGNGFSNREVLETVEEVTGHKLSITPGPRRAGDPPILVASSKKAEAELGWQPQKPQLREMVQDAWQFYQSLA